MVSDQNQFSNPETGIKIYDFLMGRILPELKSSELPLLSERYKDETPEERQARAERYEMAFQEYDKAYGEFLTRFKAGVSRLKKDALRSAEADQAKYETEALTALESQMSNV